MKKNGYAVMEQEKENRDLTIDGGGSNSESNDDEYSSGMGRTHNNSKFRGSNAMGTTTGSKMGRANVPIPGEYGINNQKRSDLNNSAINYSNAG